MKEIKILHLFPKLLSLYGEYGNMAVLSKTLCQDGYAVTVDTWDDGPLDIQGYDLIYVGTGTEDNLLEAVRRLLPYQEAIRASVERGDHWLATGNAMTLFGSQITRRGATTPALDIFPYHTNIHDDKRYLGDALTADAFGAPLIGFINTSSVYEGDIPSLLTLILNPRLGNSKTDAADGIHVHNFYGTQLIGPVLAKNPHFLAHICQAITGDALHIDPESNIQKAYAISLGELKKRME